MVSHEEEGTKEEIDLSWRLKKLLRRPQGVFALGVRDPLAAIVAGKAESECIYAGGYAAAAALGLLDKGVYPSDYMIRHGRNIACAVNVPVVLDMDEGGAGVLNIQKNITDMLETAPVAMFHVEDQVTPKRCGQHGGKQVHDFETSVSRMKCVADTRDRVRPGCLFMARTDAFVAAGHKQDEKTGGDIDEVIMRANAYADVGADVVWCEFPESNLLYAFEKFAEGIHRMHPGLPLGFNVSPSNVWDNSYVTFEELNQMGYKFLFCTYGAVLQEMLGVWLLAKHFKEKGATALAELQVRMKQFPEIESINKLLGIKDATELEEEHDPTAKDRFATSHGHR